MTLVARAFPTLLIGACAGCLALSVRMAWADRLFREDRPDSVIQASQIGQGSALYWERRSEWVPSEAGAALGRAVLLNPFATSARLELAFGLEFQGKFREAESALLEAWRYDRLFLTRWTLANFYFRRGSAEGFWKWASAAAEIGGGDLAPVFDLCWRMDPTGRAIPDRVLGHRPEALRDYLSYLIVAHRTEATVEPFERLARAGMAADRSQLLRSIDVLLDLNRGSLALECWNKLADAGMIPYSRLDAARGSSITNGEFTKRPLASGFDWHPQGIPDALVNGRKIEFSGKLDRWEVLWQPVAMAPGRLYTLRLRYRTEGMKGSTGLRWRLESEQSPSLIADAGVSEWKVRAPQGEVSRLALEYAREAGTERLEGSFYVDRVELIMLPDQP